MNLSQEKLENILGGIDITISYCKNWNYISNISLLLLLHEKENLICQIIKIKTS